MRVADSVMSRNLSTQSPSHLSFCFVFALLQKNFSYKAGQYVFINIPELSLFEWHPFSISSAPHMDVVYVHVRVLGGWTKRLYELADKKGRGKWVAAFLEGCYGEPAVDVESDRYKCFLMISGGIGITPMQSIANELCEQQRRGRPMKKLWFIWSVRPLAQAGRWWCLFDVLLAHSAICPDIRLVRVVWLGDC